ncbi:MAG: hypothetical protein JNN04_15595 [Cyclobacteriaceae bacterium]|nr:hypothetical protein [Cyclobacteriaceae bacterium]
MIKDIPLPQVQHVTLAVARVKDNLLQDSWKVYLINQNTVPLENILIASTGYGERNGEEQNTSTLRHFLHRAEPHSATLVEPIDTAVFHLNNEYWVSYYIGNQLFDKRFIFLPGTICEENLSFIPELDAEGVLHS